MLGATWHAFMPHSKFGRGLLAVRLGPVTIAGAGAGAGAVAVSGVGAALAVGTVHLESPPVGTPEQRARQLAISARLLEASARELELPGGGPRSCILAGDFNFTEDTEDVQVSPLASASQPADRHPRHATLSHPCEKGCAKRQCGACCSVGEPSTCRLRGAGRSTAGRRCTAAEAHQARQ